LSVRVDSNAGWTPEPTLPKPTGRPRLPAHDPFYDPPSGFATLPEGTLLRSREVELAFLGVIRQQITAWQLLYRTSDLNGVAEAGITTVLLPSGVEPGDDRPLLAYQCAIDAVADSAFPSYALRRGAWAPGAVPQLELLVIASALDRGWVVSIADHEGQNGYFGAAREPGYRVLDGIRAALGFGPLGLRDDTPVGVWGYSGGGMASSWVVEMAPDYAPELDIVGAALGAPVGDPGQTFIRLNGTFHAGLPALVVAGLRHIYPGLDRVIEQHVDNDGLRKLDLIEKLGTVAAIVRFARDDFDDYTDIPLADLLATPEVLEVFEDIRLGERTPTCPLFVVQPIHDQIIHIEDVDGQVNRYVDGGAHVTYRRDRCSEHLSLMVLAAPTVLDWLSDRFAGRALPDAGTKTVLSMALNPSAIRGFAALARAAGKVVLGRKLGRNSEPTTIRERVRARNARRLSA
jgi:hypothetical protein